MLFSVTEPQDVVARSPLSIRFERQRAGLTLRQVATTVGVSIGTMSAIENGKVALTVERLHRIADALDLPPQQLLVVREPDEAPGSMPAARGDQSDWRTYGPLDVDPVLAAGVAVFTETGYHGATMRMIAAAADSSVAGLYHHYRSKQSLLVAIFDLTMGELGWRVPAARDSAADVVHGYANMVESLALFHTVRGELAFIGASEMRSLDEPHRARIADQRRRLQYAMDRQVEAAVAAGHFTTTQPHEVARAVTTMCTALPQWFRGQGVLTSEDIARAYARTALDMMRAVPAVSV